MFIIYEKKYPLYPSEISNEHLDFHNKENTQHKTKSSDVIPHDENRRDDYHTVAGSGHCSEVV